MIPVAAVPEPAAWASKGLQSGKDWLIGHPVASRKKGFRPYNYWSAFLEPLGEGFNWLCGYTAVFADNGTVDHFAPWEDVEGTSEEWRAYDWSNLRYAAGWFNSARKRTEVPDPFQVGPDWFRITLPSLQLLATDQVPEAQRTRVDNAMRWLKNDERVMRARRKYYKLYRAKKLTLQGLDELAPLIAEALRRQPEFQV